MFKRVLVGIDGQQGGRDAVALARQLVDPGGALLLAHVYGAETVFGRGASSAFALDQIDSAELLERERAAESLEAELISAGGSSVAAALHGIAQGHHADLLVVGSTRHALLGHIHLRDDTRDSLSEAPCAVAVAPRGYGEAPRRLRHIGVGYDDSRQSRYALAAARELATRNQAHLKALCVVSLQSVREAEPVPADWPRATAALVGDRKRRLQALGLDGQSVYGGAPEELTRFSDEVDLLVVGSRAYGPAGRVLHGSASSHLVRHAGCPVLVLPRHVHTGLEEEIDVALPPVALKERV